MSTSDPSNSPSPSLEAASPSPAARNLSYGVANFRLQPAPRSRRSAAARSSPHHHKGPESQCSSPVSQPSPLFENRGKFLEHLSWDTRPSSAELDHPPTMQPFTLSSPPEKGIRLQQSTNTLDDLVALYHHSGSGPVKETSMQTRNRRRPSVPVSVFEESCITPSFPSSGAPPLPRPAEETQVTGNYDPNVRLSTQAGTAASSRRGSSKRCSPSQPIDHPVPSTRLRRISSSSTLCCSSPLSFSPKLVGKRGQEQQKMQRDFTALSFPPMTPLTPSRADQLHTPVDARVGVGIAEIPSAELSGQAEIDRTPLSATLKEIGAKRDDITYTSDFAARKEWNVPGWAARLQANHHRCSILDANRLAADDFRPLRSSIESQRKTAKGASQTDASTLGLPQLTVAGDVAPNSPNGFLLDGDPFSPAKLPREDAMEIPRTDKAKVGKASSLSRKRSRSEPQRIESSVRGAGRFDVQTGRVSSESRRLSELIDALKLPRSLNKGWGVRLPYRRSEANEKPPEEKRDGWGGILTRSSWFRSTDKGPLLSPCLPSVPALTVAPVLLASDKQHSPRTILCEEVAVIAKPAPLLTKEVRRARFNSLKLVEMIPDRRPSEQSLTSQESEDDWEDMASLVSASSSDSSSSQESALESTNDSGLSSSQEMTLKSANNPGLSLSLETMHEAGGLSDKSLLERGVPRFATPTSPMSLCRSEAAGADDSDGRNGWQRLLGLGRLSSSSVFSVSPPPKQGHFLYDDRVIVIGQPSSPRVLPRGVPTGYPIIETMERRIVTKGENSVESTPIQAKQASRRRSWKLFAVLVIALLVSVGFNVALLVTRKNAEHHTTAPPQPTSTNAAPVIRSNVVLSDAGAAAVPPAASPPPPLTSPISTVPAASDSEESDRHDSQADASLDEANGRPQQGAGNGADDATSVAPTQLHERSYVQVDADTMHHHRSAVRSWLL
ncbi:hypothetical protein ACQY0O_000935 [Thecaphora frezii]